MSLPKALIFDAYGTLFDVYSVLSSCESRFPGAGQTLSTAWRTRQLEYAWLRSLMGRYEDFQSVTRHALRHSCKTLGLPLDASSEAELLAEYGRLAAFPDVAQALSSLGRFTRAILSNGSPAMLEAVLRHSGLSRHFDHVLSVDAVQIYKPHPKVYQFAADQLGTGPGEIGFVSSNFWDISGAASFGFRTFWLNRSRGLADELGQQPQLIVSDLSELVAHLLREDPYQA